MSLVEALPVLDPATVTQTGRTRYRLVRVTKPGSRFDVALGEQVAVAGSELVLVDWSPKETVAAALEAAPVEPGVELVVYRQRQAEVKLTVWLDD